MATILIVDDLAASVAVDALSGDGLDERRTNAVVPDDAGDDRYARRQRQPFRKLGKVVDEGRLDPSNCSLVNR